MSPRPSPQIDMIDANSETESSPAPAAIQVRMIDSDLGDSASQSAIERLDQAVTELRAIKLRPLLHRAIAALGAEDPQSAADLALEALHIDECSGLAWHVLAIAREKVCDYKSSIAAFESALALLSDHTDVAGDLGRLALRLGMGELASRLFRLYHDARPNCIQGVNNLACALRDINDYDGAINVLRPAILATPDQALLWNTLGSVLGEQGESAKTVPFFNEALRLDPSFAKARYNLANARMDLGEVTEALADFDDAIRLAIAPYDLAMMRLARSFALLCLGRIAEGWEGYEARFDTSLSGHLHFLIERPRWTPKDELTARAFLIVGEQGLGDEVLFANLIPDVLESLGPEGRLTLAVEPRLVTLFQRSFPSAVVMTHKTGKLDGHVLRAVPELDQTSIDLWTPMASLLRRFRPSVASFPDRPAFLVPDPDRVAHWRGLVADLPGPKVGLLWKSLKLDAGRLKNYSPFDQWRPVLETPGATFVNLQYGDCAPELEQARNDLGLEIWQPPGIDLKQDLDDVAALCCAMDLVIGPSNATTCLAGACGAPLWLLSPLSGWTRLGTDRYPWYPRARVFKAPGYGRWNELMPRIAEALASQIAAHGGTRAA